jgi:glutamine amidotransferase
LFYFEATNRFSTLFIYEALRREAAPAYESEFAKKLLAPPLPLQNAVFHIRYATVGAVGHENTHPLTAIDLTGRQWTIIHNGTVFNFDKLDKYFYRQNGTTDTERLLLYLVERVNRKSADSHRPLTDEERFRVVDEVLRAVAEGNKLKVALYDSEVMYVHANSRTGSRVLGESGKNDFLYELEVGDARFFSTAPLDARAWAPVRLNTLLAYKDGGIHDLVSTRRSLTRTRRFAPRSISRTKISCPMAVRTTIWSCRSGKKRTAPITRLSFRRAMGICRPRQFLIKLLHDT